MLFKKKSKRGPGEHRFESIIDQRPPRKLESGEPLLYEHALRCLCKNCGRLLNWNCPEDISFTEANCCGLKYRLKPWTVITEIEDISDRPALPQMPESDYADPNIDLSEFVIGSADVQTKIIPAKSKEDENIQPAIKPIPPNPPKKRRCGVCRSPDHTRRKCPKNI